MCRGMSTEELLRSHCQVFIGTLDLILHANDKRYVYEVRTNRVVLPNDLSVFKNDDYTWMTRWIGVSSLF